MEQVQKRQLQDDASLNKAASGEKKDDVEPKLFKEELILNKQLTSENSQIGSPDNKFDEVDAIGFVQLNTTHNKKLPGEMST